MPDAAPLAQRFRLQSGILLELNESETRWFLVARVPDTINTLDQAISWHQQQEMAKQAAVLDDGKQRKVAS